MTCIVGKSDATDYLVSEEGGACLGGIYSDLSFE